jgi:hypothetical protein
MLDANTNSACLSYNFEKSNATCRDDITWKTRAKKSLLSSNNVGCSDDRTLQVVTLKTNLTKYTHSIITDSDMVPSFLVNFPIVSKN